MAASGNKLVVPHLLPESPVKDDDEDDHQSVTSAIEDSPKRGRKVKRDHKESLIKAPQAPKRFKSSYICFFMSQQPHIKQELGETASVSDISKRSAELWRNLPPEERVHWDDVAAKDKHRYLMEKSQYTGPWQVTKKKIKKDPSAPKRPMSAFLHFSLGRRQSIRDQNPDMVNTEVSRVLGEQWRNATEEEKEPFIQREKIERERYKTAIAEWRTENEHKKKQHHHQHGGEERGGFHQGSHQYPHRPAVPYSSQDIIGEGQQQSTYHQSSLSYGHGSTTYGIQPNSPLHQQYPQNPSPYLGAPDNQYANGLTTQEGPTQFSSSGKGPMILVPNGMPHTVIPPTRLPIILGPTGMPRFMMTPQQQQTVPTSSSESGSSSSLLPIVQQQQHHTHSYSSIPPTPGMETNEAVQDHQSNSQSFDFLVERISE